MKLTRLFTIVAALAGLLLVTAYGVHAAAGGNLPASHPEALIWALERGSRSGRVASASCLYVETPLANSRSRWLM